VVYINKVYTRFGDAGDTMLASGDTVGKDSLRVAAYGEVDELNATLGLLRVEIGRAELGAVGDQPTFLTALDEALARIQQELFDLGAELAEPGAATGKARLCVFDADVTRLEHELDALNEPLPPLRSFILPGGGPVGAAAHLARTVCRRAERQAVTLSRHEPVRGEALRYLNRLSDLLFVIARAAAQRLGHAEVLWDTQRRRPA
jgi:cob(I)alamin adenosyltransferase